MGKYFWHNKRPEMKIKLNLKAIIEELKVI
jgi:hypothetical protein